jgi:hypothetical protein
MTRIDTASRPTAAAYLAQTQQGGTASGVAATNAARAPASSEQMASMRQMRAAQAEILRQLVGYILGHIAQAMGGAGIKKGLSKSKAAPYGSDLLRAQTDAGWKDLSKRAGIGGAKDITRFSQSMDKLEKSRARVLTPEAAATAKTKLTFSPEEAARIKAAPTQEAAKAEVLKIISERTGKNVGPMGSKLSRSKKESNERDALNALLGTRVKAGHEKNATSAIILDGLADSVASAVRAHTPQTASAPVVAAPPTFGDDAVNTPTPPVCPPEHGGEVSVDIGDYTDPANKAAELASPLIFDLAGVGLKLKRGERVEIDIDGDGKGEVITNLDDGIGLLVFDALDGIEVPGAGRDYFGDRTDLSAYGISSGRDDGMWENGFDALRALCERFNLVHADKQYLDEADLAFLEGEIGLRMRIEGLFGKDRGFKELGITRINLGDPNKIQSIRAASEDRFGNKLMKQEGATFVVKGAERDYADIWFNVVARAVERTSAPA